jgi:hypothetical protein
MRTRLPALALALAACLGGACGGNVVIDEPDEGGGSTTTSSTTTTTTPPPCEPCGAQCTPCAGCEAIGFCNSAGECVVGPPVACPPPGPCDGQPCGAQCTVCNDIECLFGACDSSGSCTPEAICP